MASKRKRIQWLYLVGSLFLLSSTNAGAQSKEYPVKSIFLFNFTQFVEWPTNAFRDPAAPIVIGVVGEDPFGTLLDEAVKGETVSGRPLSVRRYRRTDPI